MLPSIAVFDDFLRVPMRPRTDALRLGYDPKVNHGNYAGLISDKPLAIKGLVESVSSRIGAPWEAAAGTALTHCRLPYKDGKARSRVHVYPSYYSGILFLNAPEHFRGGRIFMRIDGQGWTEFLKIRSTCLLQATTIPISGLKMS